MSKINLDNLKDKKIALVLSGGVVKAAAWHLGVALALEDLGFTLVNNSTAKNTALPSHLKISTYVGSSAGALISLYLAAGVSPKQAIGSVLGTNRDKTFRPITYKDMFHIRGKMVKRTKYHSFNPFEGLPLYLNKMISPIRNFPGFFSTEGLRKYLLKYVVDNDSFENFNADLFIVATQLDHSRKVIFSKYSYPNPTHDRTSTYYKGFSVTDACAASMSVPPFYQPYLIYNDLTNQYDYYIDGEIRDTLSTHVAEDNGCDIIISSYTHTPYHYHDEVGSLINYGLPAIVVQSIYLMIQKKIVTSRARRATSKDIIDTIYDYMKSNSFSDRDRRNIMSILEKKLHYKKNVELIDIHPSPSDYKMFFANSFSLRPKTNNYIVRRAYKATMERLSDEPRS